MARRSKNENCGFCGQLPTNRTATEISVPLGKRSRKRVGIRQIADATGLSLMTVSRALNGKTEVLPATRDRVLAAASQLDYRPNGLGRALKSGRSGTVGVVAPPANDFCSQVILGVHDRLAEAGVAPILQCCPKGGETHDATRELLHRLVELRVEGVIFWPMGANDQADLLPDIYFHEVWERGLPLVALDRAMPRTHADFSGTDDAGGGRLAAEHLLGLGHRRIVHLGGPGIGTYADRRAGFERALERMGGVDYSFRRCENAECAGEAAAVLRQPAATRPTAIFVSNDYYAVGVYDAARSLGLEIGRDLSVVGFADVPLASLLFPKLTTVKQDAIQIGRNAAELLLDRIEGRVEALQPRVVRIGCELVVRSSTGPAPA
jgi:LacI family transcriptional regulator